MIKVHVAADGTKSFQVYERARVREKSIKVYVGSFASRREAEFAAQQHRVTQGGIKAGELPVAVDHKRTMGDSLDARLKAIKDQRSHDEYESRMRLYVRPAFDSTPLVKITKPKLIDLRNSLKEREEPLGNATINTLFASLSAAYSYFIEQGRCSENPLKFVRDLEVAERPFLWLQSAGEVQKLLSACNENIRTLVAVLVGTGMRLDEALHLMWVDVDLTHRVIHVHRGRRGAPKSGRLRHVQIFDSVLTMLREMSSRRARTRCSGLARSSTSTASRCLATRRACSVRSRQRCCVQASTRNSACTTCDTRSRGSSSRPAATSSSYRRFSATPASRSRRRSMRTSTRTRSPRTTAASRTRCPREPVLC